MYYFVSRTFLHLLLSLSSIIISAFAALPRASERNMQSLCTLYFMFFDCVIDRSLALQKHLHIPSFVFRCAAVPYYGLIEAVFDQG